MGQHYTGPIIPYRYMASGALEPLNAYMNEYTNRRFLNPSSQVPNRSGISLDLRRSLDCHKKYDEQN
jgi:hypothetical protein